MSDVIISTPLTQSPVSGTSTYTWRRVLFGGLVTASIGALLGLMTLVLSPGGLSATDMALLVLFAITLPWMVVGLWTSVIGFLILRFAADPVAVALPAAARVRGNEPITVSVALLVFIRNEVPERVLRTLVPMLEGLAASGAVDRFHLYLLSDTDDADCIVTEAAVFTALEESWRGRIAMTYRRRTANTGFKAGNLREFCESYGDRHTLGVTLDADSYMPASAILRTVRVMQAAPEIGILQGLIIARPAASAFARLFQFGMRLEMRAYTLGSAWWQGDCGPHWGHNSVLRLAPFKAHCDVAPLEARGLFCGPVLSHDQLEAVLMRRAGYEVRILPEETLGNEDNPPTVTEFIRRDLRWCRGNLQYARLLLLPGLKPVSRYQLLLALLMFLDWPAWIAMLVLVTLTAAFAHAPADLVRADAGIALLAAVTVMRLAPLLATLFDILMRPNERRAFGGAKRLLAGVLAHLAFIAILSPVRWLSGMLAVRTLIGGASAGWSRQQRDSHAVQFRAALRDFWPHTALGLLSLVTLVLMAPQALPCALLLGAGGLALAIPMAVVTADTGFGAYLARRGIASLPEEVTAVPAVMPTAETVSRPSTLQRLRTARGILRSLRIYHLGRGRHAGMDRLYRRFVAPGDLVFDIGAHVGDRTAAFRRLGARVLAVEPQPMLARTLRLIFGRDRAVTVEQAAVGEASGTADLHINPANPTVSSASDAFIGAARTAADWSDQRWTHIVTVPLTTLDALIERHGVPGFMKIDVEGFEARTLAGLTHPIAALSFEFTTIQRDVALACIEQCMALGFDAFDAALGESQVFVHGSGVTGAVISQWLADLPAAANSGDIYAFRSNA